MSESSEENIYLSIVIPAYNEEHRITKTLSDILQFLAGKSYQYEIIVVNDGSDDETARVVSDLNNAFSVIRIIDSRENMGKGWAVRTGMLNAKGSIRLFMDADNSTTVEQFENMEPYFKQGYGVVIGSRVIPGAVITEHQSRFRECLGRFFNFIARQLSGIDMKDTQAGFKAFTSDAAGDIFHKQTVDRWAFDVELLVIAKELGFRVKEVPVTWVNDARSHVKLHHAFMTGWELLKIRFNSMKGIYRENA